MILVIELYSALTQRQLWIPAIILLIVLSFLFWPRVRLLSVCNVDGELEEAMFVSQVRVCDTLWGLLVVGPGSQGHTALVCNKHLSEVTCVCCAHIGKSLL